MTTRGSFLAGLGLFAGTTVLIIAGGAWAAEPQPWQFGLQPPAGSIAEKATSLHNLLLVIITAISLFVLALLCIPVCGSVSQLTQNHQRLRTMR